MAKLVPIVESDQSF